MLTYQDLVFGLMDSARQEPNIGFTGCRDIYDLNKLATLDYSVFYITPNTFTITEDLTIYSLNLYYIDRWDETSNNQINTQSVGMVTLQNIINRYVNNTDEVNVNYPLIAQPFYQKFKDETAGVYIKVDFVVPNLGLCDYD